MLNATEDIVLFNARIGSDRREIYLPTLIRSVCLYVAKGTSGEPGEKSSGEKYTIRIPFDAIADDGKTYIEAERFRLLDDTEVKKHWTIQIGDYVASNALYPSEIWKWDSFSLCGGHIVDEMRGDPLSGDVGTILTKKYGKILIVDSFADNTRRGSRKMKHWRIGGT